MFHVFPIVLTNIAQDLVFAIIELNWRYLGDHEFHLKITLKTVAFIRNKEGCARYQTLV